MFTGKNKEDFENWFLIKSKINVDLVKLGVIPLGRSITKIFYDLPFSMQQGVYLEYLDSVEISVEIYIENGYTAMINQDATWDNFDTRQEALTKAFKKADELINNK